MTSAEKDAQYFFPTYKRVPLDIARGEGVYLIAKDGRRYLDMFAGIAVNALGYNHPAVNKAIIDQLGRFVHLSNVYYQDTQIRLAEKILGASGYSKIFFTNSGTEAMEGALKLARKWGKTQGRTMLYGLSNSFHGRTYGSLSITGREKYRTGYEPLLPSTGILPFNDVQSLGEGVNDSTLAVVLEFIQGEGGINLVSKEYVAALDELRARHGFLVIADEIQTGIGRTGRLFSYEHYGIEPDIVVSAKALGGGLPLGAFLAKEALADVFSVGSHGTTFGGNPVSCAAGLATLKEVLDNGVMENASTVGRFLKHRLEEGASQNPKRVKAVRGVGLMLGVELTFDANSFADALRENGLLLNVTNNNILRLVPPLILTIGEAERASSILFDALKQWIPPTPSEIGHLSLKNS